jgi:hypothetical protein
MQNNQETVEYLTAFIASSRAEEHYHILCEHCGTSIPTAESRQQVADAKQLAAQLIMQLSDPNAPVDAWAELVSRTVFDSSDAIYARTPVVKTEPLSEEAQLARMKATLASMKSGNSSKIDPNAERTGPFGHDDFKDAWGLTRYENRVSYTKARAIKGSNANPHGLERIPDHHSLCPNKPEPVAV